MKLLLACLLVSAARAQELEALRLEFLVDHLAEMMTDAWDVTGTIAELIETSVPDHRDDLVGGAEALRKAMFASLRMLADKGKVYMIYAGFEVDGTFVGYYGEGMNERTATTGYDYFYALLRGWDCAWQYVDSCATGCAGDCTADVSVPCADGYKGANPACRRKYDVANTTGVPASCASAVSCTGYLDDHYSAGVYDPRMRPWYQVVSTERPRAWSDIYTFASEGVPGITSAWHFANAGGGVVGVDLKLGSIQQIVADAYATTASAYTPVYVTAAGKIVAASDASVALVDATGEQVAASNCSSAAIRACEGYLAGRASFEGQADDIVTVDGVAYWLFRGGVADAYGLEWTVVALHEASCIAGFGLRGSVCRPCPKGSTSEAGAPTCDVRAHYYRWIGSAVDLWRCPAHDDACRGQRGAGGAGAALCAAEATGPLCMLCERGHHRVVSRTGKARCKSCGDWNRMAQVYAYLVVLVGAALVALLAARKALAREVRTLTDRLRAKSRLHGFDRALPTLWIVGRQAIYAITVMSQVRSVERLSLPLPYANLMDVLTAFAIDIDKYLGPLACFEINYYQELLFWTLLPPVALAVAVTVTVASVMTRRLVTSCRPCKRQKEVARPVERFERAWKGVSAQITAVDAFRAGARAPERAPSDGPTQRTLADSLRSVVTGWIIACIHLHSFTCGVIYKAFVCARPHGNEDTFLTDRGEKAFLRADYGLVCGTRTHRAYVMYATLALITYATFPAVLALRLWASRTRNEPDRYLAFMVSHLRPGAWALECVAMWYRMLLSGALWLFFRRDQDIARLGLSVVAVVVFVVAISFAKPYATEGKRQACTMIQHALLIFFCLAIAVKAEIFSPHRAALFGTIAFVATLGLAGGVAWHVWRADVRALVDGLHAYKLDRLALRRLYEGAEKAVIGEAILEAVLAPIEEGLEHGDERWEFVETELFGSHGATHEVLRGVWDAQDAEHLEPWLSLVRAQASRKLSANKDDAVSASEFAADVDAAAPWLSLWLAPHIENSYKLVAGDESLKSHDALLAFDVTVVRALGGAEPVDAVRKKLHGVTQTPTEAPHSVQTKFAPASSFSHALKRASRKILGHPHDGDPYAFVKPQAPPLCSRYTVLAIRAKALALQSDDAMKTLAKEAMDNDAGRVLMERGSVGLSTAVEQPALAADALKAYVKTLGGDALRDRVDADALPDILHALAGGAHASFRSELAAIVDACQGSALMGDCEAHTAIKSITRMRAKVHEYRSEDKRWPACARVQDPLRATILCSSAAVMLQALQKVECAPFKLLRLKNNLASSKKPFNLHAVLEFAAPTAGVPLVVEVQLLFDHLLPLFKHTHNLYSVYRARSFGARHAGEGATIWAPPT